MAKKCESCNLLNNNSSVEGKKLYEKLWENVEVVELNGKKRVKCKYEYKRDIKKVFAPVIDKQTKKTRGNSYERFCCLN